MKKLSSLTTISPIDGRYNNYTFPLRKIFSEYAFIKFRVQIEIQWLKTLSNTKKIKELPKFSKKINKLLENIINNFSEKDAIKIKKIEKITKHDVKAIEYFLKEKISLIPQLKSKIEFIHFACTSEDINNLSYALMLKNAKENIIFPHWKKLINYTKKLSIKYKNIPMLSRTHGQIATPSTLGKEIANFVYRMKRQYNQLKKIEILGKINGAVGNYNAHYFSYPSVNWIKLSKEFVNSFKIQWNPYTTQIEPHDYIAEFFDCISRFNTILINLNCDMWGYISLNYIKQKSKKNQIGSSTMPHKINPIDFENSEGNLGLSNTILKYFCRKLPISRWQRDLSDSTVLRNLGVGISYSIIGYKSILKGLNQIEVNKNNIKKDLNENWEVLTEGIQTIMRKYNIKNPYEKIKDFIYGKKIKSSDIKNFINNLEIPEIIKNKIIQTTPSLYIGLAKKLVNNLKKLN